MRAIIGIVCTLLGAATIESDNMIVPGMFLTLAILFLGLEAISEAKKNHQHNHDHDASYPSYLR